MDFKLTSQYKPTGDQPQAIEQLSKSIQDGERSQVLLGVTGSGKTFTMANVIQEVEKPTLILSHNKTLAAQLYGEFKQFFPDNAVEYFVSYYDYYQPEAYIPTSDTYIEKDLSINDEIEKLRLSATSSLLSGRRDVIVVSSVSCIYGIGNPSDFNESVIEIKQGMTISRNQFLHKLVDSLYSRTTGDFQRGNFRVKGDTVDVYLAYADHAFRFHFWGDEIEEIESIDPHSAERLDSFEAVRIYPANIFVTSKESTQRAIKEIGYDLIDRVEYFKDMGQPLEAKRIDDRVNYDLEMMRELGYCSGIENYSRYFDRRNPGDRPFCLLDYFPDDFLLIIDESHVTVPQISAMYGGDRARKVNLVEYGFRLPAALDNRPLKFEEFQGLINQIMYVSATPAEYELRETEGVYVEQVIRPTGLLDPKIEVRPRDNQVDDLLEEVRVRTERKERVLVTTLTKRMSEELAKYMTKNGIKCRYIHSDIDTLERVEILRDLRLGNFDVLIGINLLREGLDLPEVSLVAILDADNEGFLRSETSMTQTAGRAARNVNGKVIMYADRVTKSMQRTIDETNRRRAKQQEYNEEHGITPTPLVKSVDRIMDQTSVVEGKDGERQVKPEKAYVEPQQTSVAADPVVQYMDKHQLEKQKEQIKSQMMKSSKQMDFIEAARLRDEMYEIQKMIDDKED
ncbi:excinuclease ABC subunit UvrB [Salibacter sp.]|uniref:excinuclease ABC subunit UvrB n=1 Tax=Salibacter sp. TaxID=2010995 RepID=UPI00286FDEE6|nr:excinuclease ABC subunit UvrB [Salibacter sp.]MDR9399399.1 excinuclease ABC subunit UvrB [Salibacter sp.]MDR9488325.1 excinuclease ABC subunit UvrB [Salibacter sp.]